MRVFRVLICAITTVFCIALTSGQDASARCASLKSKELNKLENIYSRGDIRVFWTEKAPEAGADHRLPPQSARDENGNGVPDFIENIARQADAARKTYNHLGFRDPFDSPKYQAVQFIDINVLDMGYNGLAYDSPVNYPAAPGRGTECTLRIDVSSRLETHMIGPADNRRQAVFTRHWFVVGHEVFHLFQYGLTLFKRSWINEPTAKWAEYALRHRDLYPLGTSPYRLPATAREFRTRIIDDPTGTTANRFWSRLINLTDSSSGKLRLPPALFSEVYTDGQPVFKGGTLRGTVLINAIFRTLDAEDGVVSQINDWDALSWPESDQTSDDHDARLLAVIQQVIRETGITNPEIEAFLDIKL